MAHANRSIREDSAWLIPFRLACAVVDTACGQLGAVGEFVAPLVWSGGFACSAAAKAAGAVKKRLASALAAGANTVAIAALVPAIMLSSAMSVATAIALNAVASDEQKPVYPPG